MKLGVNIDHIAYLRETRKINDPDPLEAIFVAKKAGADEITVHLREDRRHICEFDLRRILESSFLPVNVECSTNKEILEIVLKMNPHRITLVPEKREEVTTEGGLALVDSLLPLLERIKNEEIEIFLFVDPRLEIIERILQWKEKVGLIGLELHTGCYANIALMLYSNLSRTHNTIKEFQKKRSELKNRIDTELKDIESTSNLATKEGLPVYAGHGLNYQNVAGIARIKAIKGLNIGQSIIARSIFTGLEKAIFDMKEIIDKTRR